ncbi:stress-response A/B barrel domain-containing protein HS1 [Phalaenopsis equestris]|uniref:stress-response A/B barrel domain-containing protein HS1 n=1 Tax=Phalaenopsis equestris TaxID=78828 RepID=UPI0009E62149|nr:stress-response A/B barrel domain-containing protein HS1 [Phalaenopsis equestris]
MEVATGVVKHVLLGKFKDDVSPEKIEELIKDWANLVNVIEPMKDFHWGTDVSMENKNEGFTHIFVSSFESTEGIAEYLYHPAHVEYGKKSLPFVEKFVVFDYKPTIFKQ